MKRSALGLLIALVGVAFLLRNFNVLPELTYYLFSWRNIFFLIGFGMLVSGKPNAAAVFVILGIVFWIKRFVYFDWGMMWPVALIVIGLVFLYRRKSGPESVSTGTTEFNEVTIFSGSNKIITDPAFPGGKVTTIFGGTEIDLRGANPAEGATIDFLCMFGGAEIKAPPHWKINVHTTPIFGGISDERRKSDESGPTLKLTGLVMFGGVEIKS